MNNGKCTIKKEMPPLQVRRQLDSLKQQVECLRRRVKVLKEKTVTVTSVFPSINKPDKEVKPEELVPLANELRILADEISSVNVLIDGLNHDIEL